MKNWHTQCGITGGWLWIFDQIAGTDLVRKYAHAITSGVGGSGTVAALRTAPSLGWALRLAGSLGALARGPVVGRIRAYEPLRAVTR